MRLRGRGAPVKRRLASIRLGRRGMAGLGAILAVAAATGVVIATAAPGSSRGAKSGAAPSGAATVQRRDLVETDTESGTLSFANPQTVFNRLSGTITSLPSVGQVIRPGQTLYEVDNQPVVLLTGSTPAFRDLSAADSPGPDILELNRDLVHLGFDASDPITVNDTWQAATTDAVERWQGSLGQPQTGTITLGQVVFLPGPQRVTTIDAVLGSTGGSGGGSSAGSGGASSAGSDSGGSSASDASSTGASTAVIARPEFVSFTTTTTSPPPHRSSGSGRRPRSSGGPSSGSGTGGSASAMLAEIKALEALLKVETLELRSERSAASSARGGASAATRGSGSAGASGRSAGGAGEGGGGGAAASTGSPAAASGGAANAQPIMQTSSTQLIVTVDLDASKQSEAVVGEPVTVQMPNGSTVDGKITAVSPVAQTSSSSSSGSGSGSSSAGGSSGSTATIPVTVTVSSHLPSTGLDQAAVSVNFQEQVENNVLSVPVTALLATQGGGYAVQEAAPPHRLLPVTPGLFAAGYVQISGSEIFPGLQVTDSQG